MWGSPRGDSSKKKNVGKERAMGTKKPLEKGWVKRGTFGHRIFGRGSRGKREKKRLRKGPPLYEDQAEHEGKPTRGLPKENQRLDRGWVPGITINGKKSMQCTWGGTEVARSGLQNVRSANCCWEKLGLE